MRSARAIWVIPAALLVFVASCAGTKESVGPASVTPVDTSERAAAAAKVMALKETLKSDDARVRAKATDELSKLGSPAVDDLVKGLDSDSIHVRYGCATALGRIGEVRAIGPMLEALDDPEEPVRDALATAMGKMGPDAIAPLIKATSNRTLHIRWGALKALGELTPPRGAPVGESVYEAAMKDLNERRMPVFLKALTDDDWNIRWIAAASLAKIKDARAVAPLVKALKTEENDVVRDQVVAALSTMKDRKTVIEVIESLRGADARQQETIANTLRRMTGAKVEENTFDAWKAWYDQTK